MHIQGVEVRLHPFLISALDRSDWPPSRPGRFTLGKEREYLRNRSFEGGGTKGRAGRLGEDKNLFPLRRLEHRIVQLVAKSLY
jgi:hypothetical protein